MSTNGAGEPELWIVVTNWERFQHYSDRDPPWIKTYPRLMSDDNYLSLTDHCALMLHRLWLEYARSGCRLRVDTAMMSRRLSMKVTMRHLKLLNHAGFIEFLLAPKHASASRAGGETETYKEETQDQKQNLLPANAALDAARSIADSLEQAGRQFEDDPEKDIAWS